MLIPVQQIWVRIPSGTLISLSVKTEGLFCFHPKGSFYPFHFNSTYFSSAVRLRTSKLFVNEHKHHKNGQKHCFEPINKNGMLLAYPRKIKLHDVQDKLKNRIKKSLEKQRFYPDQCRWISNWFVLLPDAIALCKLRMEL